MQAEGHSTYQNFIIFLPPIDGGKRYAWLGTVSRCYYYYKPPLSCFSCKAMPSHGNTEDNLIMLTIMYLDACTANAKLPWCRPLSPCHLKFQALPFFKKILNTSVGRPFNSKTAKSSSHSLFLIVKPRPVSKRSNILVSPLVWHGWNTRILPLPNA